MGNTMTKLKGIACILKWRSWTAGDSSFENDEFAMEFIAEELEQCICEIESYFITVK